MNTLAIIPASGKGIRSGFSVPKQYLKFKEKELIVYTLEVFEQNDLIDEIIISVEEAYINLLHELKVKYNLKKLSKIVKGGKERQDSVFNALISIGSLSQEIMIVVHDAVRPLLPQHILSNAIKTAKQKGNALVCMKAKDTLATGKNVVESFLDRDKTYYVQTPQIFPYRVLLRAMKNARAKKILGTDESMLVKEIGENVNIVEGSVYNFKVTNTDDIDMFEKLI